MIPEGWSIASKRAGTVQSGKERGIIAHYSIKGAIGELERELIDCINRTRGNVFTMKEDGIKLHVVKEFLAVRMERSWHRFPREAMTSPSLEVFKTRLDGAGSNLVWWKVLLPRVGSWKNMISNVPTNPNHPMTL